MLQLKTIFKSLSRKYLSDKEQLENCLHEVRIIKVLQRSLKIDFFVRLILLFKEEEK